MACCAARAARQFPVVPFPAAATPSGGEASQLADLRRELQQLQFSALKKRAIAAGVCEEELVAAEDSATPKAALLDCLIGIEKAKLDAEGPTALSDAAGTPRAPSKRVQAVLEALRQELEGLKMSELKKRAVAAEVGEQQLDDAADRDDPKGAVVSILIGVERAAIERAAHLAVAKTDAAAAAVAQRRQSHFHTTLCGFL